MAKHRKHYPQAGPGTKSPSYLLLRSSTWYFRFALPPGIRKMLGGMRELKMSLGTGQVREAKLKAGKWASNAYEACRYLSNQRGSTPRVEELKFFMKNAVINGLSHFGNTPTPLPILPQGSAKSISSTDLPSTERITSPLLSEAIDAYCAEKERAQAWTPRTVKDFIPKLLFFNEQVGDLFISELNRNQIRHFKDIVDKLPARYGISKEFKEMSLSEIMSGMVPLDKRMTPSSLSKYYGVINSFLLWLQKNYDDIHPGLEKILSIKLAVQVDLLRNVFTDDDIVKIFTSREYRESAFNADYKYWLPLIGYYTGMRIEEICQLYTSDIRQQDSIWYFDISDDGEKCLKTKAAIRKVPIHPLLIERFHFHDFVAKQKNRGVQRLFPELKKHSGRYSHYASRWFNGDYLVKVGVKNETTSGKVFHSFRHTFANACKLSGVGEHMARELLGHEVGKKSITYGRYGKKYPLDVVYREAICKICLKNLADI